MEILFELTIGALLHDIGKIVQRASGNIKEKRHQEFGAEWLNSLPFDIKEIIGPAEEFILRHHTVSKNDPKYDKLDARGSYRGDILIVWEADTLSSGERYKEDFEEVIDEKDVKKEVKFDAYSPLYSVLNRIKVEGRPPMEPGDYLAFPAAYIDKQNIILPQKLEKLTSNDYRLLLDKFTTDLKDIRFYADDHKKITQFILNLLEEYFSFVPSETAFIPDNKETYPDVSLFDHLKTTAAIASSMYLYFEENNIEPGSLTDSLVRNRDEKRYILIGGDFSGIQDFVYSVTYRAALRGLRARSLYLELMGEHVANEILENLGLSRANLLYIGGGNFFILAPNTSKARNLVEKIQERFNRWLLKEFDGKLFLSLDFVEFPGKAFLIDEENNISKIWAELYEKFSSQKAKKFHNILDLAHFTPPQKRGSVCQVCGKYVIGENELLTKQDEDTGEEYRLCKSCFSLERFGSKVSSAKFIDVTAAPQKYSVKIENLFYYPTEIDIPSEDIVRKYSINQYFLADIPLFVGNYPETNVEFEEIVKHSIGSNYLGTIRADVDNLGLIFSRGLKVVSISRLTTLSRLFTLFFKHYINLIAERKIPDELKFNYGDKIDSNEGRDLAIVYSGGDDLYITGAWSDVAAFAFELNRVFRKFVGYNPSITLSAGAILTHHKYPLYKISQLAGDAEEKSKEQPTKSSFTFLGSTFTWDEWEDIIKNIFTPLISMGDFKVEGHKRFIPRFPRRLIYKLLTLHKVFEEFSEQHPKECTSKDSKTESKEYSDDAFMVLPLVAYVLGRSAPKDEDLENWSKFTSKAVSLNISETLDWFKKIKSPLMWVDYLSRGGEE